MRPSLLALPAIGPGPTTGYYDAETDTGYYGETTAAQLISGDALSSEFGILSGIPQYSDAGWIKFYVGENAACNRAGAAYILYVAKKPIRYNISWDQINIFIPVDGSGEQITIGSFNYKVRLLTGADANPSTYGTTCAQNPGENSEWNDLLYRVHTDTPNCITPSEGMSGGNETTRHGGSQIGGNWATLTDADLITSFAEGLGSYCWCQEIDAADALRRIVRGRGGIARYFTQYFTDTNTDLGWRPALELVQA